MLQVCLSVRYEMKTYTVLIYISRILAVYEVLLCNEIVETKSNMKRTVMYCIYMTPERVCVPEWKSQSSPATGMNSYEFLE